MSHFLSKFCIRNVSKPIQPVSARCGFPGGARRPAEPPQEGRAMNSDGDGTPSLPPHPMVGPPFHRRPRAAKMAAPHAGGSQLVATESAVAQERDPPGVPVGGDAVARQRDPPHAARRGRLAPPLRREIVTGRRSGRQSMPDRGRPRRNRVPNLRTRGTTPAPTISGRRSGRTRTSGSGQTG